MHKKNKKEKPKTEKPRKKQAIRNLFTNTKLLEANVFSQAVLYLKKLNTRKTRKTKCKFSHKYTELYDLCIDSNILDFMVVK